VLILQVQPPGANSPTIITGDVMVAKHPVTCPGDVRVVQAVHHPRLTNLYTNVVVSRGVEHLRFWGYEEEEEEAW
jgi:hypothetical protein